MTVQVPPPPPARGGSRRWWILGGAIATPVAAVLALALLLSGRGGMLVEAPPTTEETTPADAPASVAPGTTAPGSPSRRERASDPGGAPPEGIEEITEQVAAVRGLPAPDDLHVRVLPPAELGAKFTELAFAEYDEEQLELDDRLLTALRLLHPSDDLRATIDELYRAQILGLYAVEEKVLYIGGQSARLTAAQRITAAHEVLHALQDEAFDLDAFMDLGDDESDAQLARLALAEGDAILTQELWSAQFQSEADRQAAREESARESTEALAAAPPYVRETLVFPYREGFLFVQALFQHGGYPAVDAAFDRPPASTRHVMRPETYLAGETHTPTTVTTDPGDGWEDASTYTFGEFDVDQWLATLGPQRHDVTAGWDGGETRHWTRGDEDAVAVTLRLATAPAARAACAAVDDWYAAAAGGVRTAGGLQRGDRDWMATTCTGLDVVVALAPDEATALRLAGR
jgi:hypothetical protein